MCFDWINPNLFIQAACRDHKRKLIFINFYKLIIGCPNGTNWQEMSNWKDCVCDTTIWGERRQYTPPVDPNDFFDAGTCEFVACPTG